MPTALAKDNPKMNPRVEQDVAFLLWFLLKLVTSCRPKITNKLLSWRPKSCKIGLRGRLGRVLGRLRQSWGPSWPQEATRFENVNSRAASWELSWSTKSIKIGPKSDPTCDHFLDWFGEPFLKRFGANLDQFWFPKPSQSEAKLATKSIQVGVLIWYLFSEGCCIDF